MVLSKIIGAIVYYKLPLNLVPIRNLDPLGEKIN
jgi:hypothetical protein